MSQILILIESDISAKDARNIVALIKAASFSSQYQLELKGIDNSAYWLSLSTKNSFTHSLTPDVRIHYTFQLHEKKISLNNYQALKNFAAEFGAFLTHLLKQSDQFKERFSATNLDLLNQLHQVEEETDKKITAEYISHYQKIQQISRIAKNNEQGGAAIRKMKKAPIEAKNNVNQISIPLNGQSQIERQRNQKILTENESPLLEQSSTLQTIKTYSKSEPENGPESPVAMSSLNQTRTLFLPSSITKTKVMTVTALGLGLASIPLFFLEPVIGVALLMMALMLLMVLENKRSQLFEETPTLRIFSGLGIPK